MKRIYTSCTIFVLFIFSQSPLQAQLPEGARANLGKSTLRCMAYSPDGSLLVIGTEIGVWVYDAQSYEELAFLTGHIKAVTGVVFSPNGKMFASHGKNDRTIYLWDTATFTRLHTLTHNIRYWSVVFSPDSKMLVCCGNGNRDNIYSNPIELWDTETGTLVHEITEDVSPSPDKVMLSPDGKTLVSQSRKEIVFRDLETGNSFRKLTVPNATMYHMTFSPDFKTLASVVYKRTEDGRNDTFIYFWDANTGNLIRTIDVVPLYGLDNAIFGLMFSPDGQLLLGYDWNDPIRVWNVNTGELVDTFFAGGSRGVAQGINDWTFTPDGQTLALASLGGYIELWDANTLTYKSETGITGFTDYVFSVGFSYDGKIVASGHAAARIRLWNEETGDFIRELIGHSSNVVGVAFSPTEPILASASYDRTIRLWAYNKPLIFINGGITGAALATINTTHTTVITCMAFSGQMLASGGGGTVRLYDANTGKELHVLDKDNSANSLAFSPDGKILAVGHLGGTSLYDVRTGTLLYKTAEGDWYLKLVSSLAFSPDGKTLAVGTRTPKAYLLDVNTGEFLRYFRGFYDNYDESPIYPIDTETGEQIRSFAGTEYMWDVKSLAFSG